MAFTFNEKQERFLAIAKGELRPGVHQGEPQGDSSSRAAARVSKVDRMALLAHPSMRTAGCPAGKLT